MNKFTLNKLIVLNNDKSIFDVDFTSFSPNEREALLSTVIIGENGTGKSFLLNIIVDIFRFLEFRNKNITLKYSHYNIEYTLGNVIYRVEIFNNSIDMIWANGKEIKYENLVLPKKVLAVSYMVNDKFTFTSADQTTTKSSYRYLGVRRTTNATWTNTLERKISELILNNYHKKNFRIKIKEILNLLDFTPEISLIFVPKNKNFFYENVTPYKIQGFNNKNNISDSEYKNLTYFIKNVFNEASQINIDNSIGLNYDLSLDTLSNNHFLEHSNELKQLIKLKLIKPPTLKLHKDDEFDFVHASSGEKHLLFTLLSIASEIEENSIVLIDEPEISLHPNWQINYINNIKKLFNNYTSCHFILATHSHYLVSDLKPSSSSIIHLSYSKYFNKYIREARLLDFKTYAWSAENVLYNVFGVRTTRNHYFEMDLRILMSLVSEKSNDLGTIKSLLDKIKSYALDKNDPIHMLIEEVERYLHNASKY